GGRLPVRVEQRGVAAPDQLPAAGGGARIDAAVAGGEADGADGHRGARLGAARDLPWRTGRPRRVVGAEVVVAAGAMTGAGSGVGVRGVGQEVGEPGRETAERRGPARAAVRRD